MIDNIKMGPKLIGACCIGAVLALLIGIVGVANLKKVARADAMMHENITMPAVYISHLTEALPTVGIELRDMLYSRDKSKVEERTRHITELSQEITEKVDLLEKSLVSPQMIKLKDEFKEARIAYR